VLVLVLEDVVVVDVRQVQVGQFQGQGRPLVVAPDTINHYVFFYFGQGKKKCILNPFGSTAACLRLRCGDACTIPRLASSLAVMTGLPEELVELIFDKLLQQYPPDVETKKAMFTRDDEQALSALTLVSLVAARRTRSHRFKCVILVCHPKATKFFKILAAFLELSFSSRQHSMGRLLPISTITTHIKMIGASCAYWNPPSTEFPNHEKTMAFILRLRNEFCLEQLSWFFDPMFKISTGFHQRLVGLLLSPTMKTLCLHSLISYPLQLEGVYIPGPSFDRTFRFGEEDGVDPEASPTDIYPSYTKLELGGCHTSGLPLPFDITLANGSIYRPFARVHAFRAFDGLPYSVVQSVLENNNGELRSLRIEANVDLPTWSRYSRSLYAVLTNTNHH